MTKQELLDKGITLKDITSAMRRAEKLISFFNHKYDYNMALASDSDKKQWRMALGRWDTFKIHRDIIKT